MPKTPQERLQDNAFKDLKLQHIVVGDQSIPKIASCIPMSATAKVSWPGMPCIEVETLIAVVISRANVPFAKRIWIGSFSISFSNI